MICTAEGWHDDGDDLEVVITIDLHVVLDRHTSAGATAVRGRDGRPPPPAGSALMTYLTRRLLASWNIPAGVLTYIAWANTPDYDTLIGLRHGVGRMTIQDQIPKLTAAIDQGKPCTLGLVTVHSADPAQLGHCHQVLAYAYDWNGAFFRTQVYDPNSPGRDDIQSGRRGALLRRAPKNRACDSSPHTAQASRKGVAGASPASP